MTMKALLARRISTSFSHTAALSTMKLGAKGPEFPHQSQLLPQPKRWGLSRTSHHHERYADSQLSQSGVNCCQNQNKVWMVDIVERGFLVASESHKELVDGFKVLGPILWIHDRQGDEVSMGCLQLSLCR